MAAFAKPSLPVLSGDFVQLFRCDRTAAVGSPDNLWPRRSKDAQAVDRRRRGFRELREIPPQKLYPRFCLKILLDIETEIDYKSLSFRFVLRAWRTYAGLFC
jgi:hypothetical protein